MGKHKQKIVRSLTGEFLGCVEDRPPHRYIKLATASGEQTIKVAKNLRSQIPNWQPRSRLNFLCQERIDLLTGKRKIKVKQLLAPPLLDDTSGQSQIAVSSITSSTNDLSSPTAIAPTEIRVCQGSSCRRLGSVGICQSIQAYIDRHDLDDRVEIKTVKCLHQCKAAPHAIFTSSDAGTPQKTHYRQLHHHQITAILNKHFPVILASTSIGANLLELMSNYLKEHIISNTSKSERMEARSCKT
jgi:(2Fe-2S) ferredoxin